MYIITTCDADGDPTHIGPFPSVDEAVAWANEHLTQEWEGFALSAPADME